MFACSQVGDLLKSRLCVTTYQPPEMTCGYAATPASDVWFFGVLLHELFTQTMPHKIFLDDDILLFDAPCPLPILDLSSQNCKDPVVRQPPAQRAMSKSDFFNENNNKWYGGGRRRRRGRSTGRGRRWERLIRRGGQVRGVCEACQAPDPADRPDFNEIFRLLSTVATTPLSSRFNHLLKQKRLLHNILPQHVRPASPPYRHR